MTGLKRLLSDITNALRCGTGFHQMDYDQRAAGGVYRCTRGVGHWRECW